MIMIQDKQCISNRRYNPQIPPSWIQGLNIKTQVANPTYLADINRYGVKCGASLEEWWEFSFT